MLGWREGALVRWVLDGRWLSERAGVLVDVRCGVADSATPLVGSIRAGLGALGRSNRARCGVLPVAESFAKMRWFELCDPSERPLFASKPVHESAPASNPDTLIINSATRLAERAEEELAGTRHGDEII